MDVKYSSIIRLVLLLLVIPIVLALDIQYESDEESESFVVFGEPEIPVYQCAPASTQLTIQNNEQKPQQYFLQYGGKAAEWAIPETNSAILNPGEHKTISINFVIPCEAKGPKILTTQIIDLMGDERIVEQKLVVYTPENVEVNAPAVHELGLCSVSSIQLSIANHVNFTELYAVSIQSDIKTSVSQEEFLIPPGEQKSLTITVDNTDCLIFEKKPLNVVVKTKNSELDAVAEIVLVQVTEGIPEITVGKLASDGSVQRATGSIKNIGEKRDHYTLSTKNISWIKIEEAEFTLEPQETKEFTIVIEPPAEAKSGEYPFKLVIVSERLDKEFKKELALEVQKPGIVQVLAGKYKKEAIRGLAGVIGVLIFALLMKKYFKSDFYKKRKLEREKRRQKLKEEKEKESAYKQKLKEERFVNKIKAEAEAELRKKYKFVNKGHAGKSAGKNFLKILIAIIVLGILAGALYGIYHARDVVFGGFAKSFTYVAEEKQNLNYAVLAVAAIIFLLFVLRALIRIRKRKEILVKLPANEEVNVPFWKKGITSISFKPSTEIEFGSVKIKKQRTKETIAGEVYGSYKCELDLPSVDHVKARFRIPANFFEKNNIEQLMLIKSGKEELLLNETDSDKKYKYYEAEIESSCTSLAVYGKVKKTMEKEKKKSLKAYALLFLVLGAFILVVTLVSKPSVEKPFGIPDQIWKQDEKHYLDLGPYFQDPDGDSLEFKATETEHVTVDIVDNIAVFIPSEGWTGQELVTFFAEDETGDFAKSNVVRLNVQKRLIPIRLEPYKKTIGVAGFFVALVLFLIILKKEFVS